MSCFGTKTGDTADASRRTKVTTDAGAATFDKMRSSVALHAWVIVAVAIRCISRSRAFRPRGHATSALLTLLGLSQALAACAGTQTACEVTSWSICNGIPGKSQSTCSQFQLWLVVGCLLVRLGRSGSLCLLPVIHFPSAAARSQKPVHLRRCRSAELPVFGFSPACFGLGRRY